MSIAIALRLRTLSSLLSGHDSMAIAEKAVRIFESKVADFFQSTIGAMNRGHRVS